MHFSVSVLSLVLAIGSVADESAPQVEGDQGARDADESAAREALAKRARAARELAERKVHPKKGAPVYLGPLGLLWRQSPAEVRAVLHDRLTFEKEFTGDRGASFVQRYSGDFGAFRTRFIDATFWHDELLGVAVILAEPDPRPAHRRWAAIVDVMTRDYGKPTQIKKPPTSSSLKIAREAKKLPEMQRSATLLESMATEQEDTFLIAEMQAGRWEPMALWKFKNALIVVGVQAQEPDESGIRPLRVTWMFAESPRFQEWHQAANAAEKKTRDY